MRRFLSLLILLVCTNFVFGQRLIFHAGKLSPDVPVKLNENWVYHPGDLARGADPKLNDSAWTSIDTRLMPDSIPAGTFTGIGWFRLWFTVDSSLANQPLCFIPEHEGASEIYLNGRLLHTFGKVSAHEALENRCVANARPVSFAVHHSGPHLLAVRYSNHAIDRSYDGRGVNAGGFNINLRDNDEYVDYFITFNELYLTLLCLVACLFFVFAVVHLLLFLAYKTKRANLYFFLFAVSISLTFTSMLVETLSTNPVIVSWADLGKVFFLPFVLFTLHLLVYSFFRNRLPKILWISGLMSLVILAALWIAPDISFFIYVLMLAPLVAVDVIRNIVIAIRKKLSGAWIIGTGMGLFALFFISMTLLMVTAFVGGNDVNLNDSIMGVLLLLLFALALISIPLSMSIYLARDFARTNRSLEAKLHEVETLSAKSIEQEKERQRILESQNIVLEQQVQERTAEISDQKKVIEEKNKDITDSINYARRIQRAMLPDDSFIKKMFPDSFVFFRPKDIVSGDFYWFGEKNGYAFAILADCTGHGVPGALMSMIGFNLLEQIIVEKEILDPGGILRALHEGVRLALRQQGDSETRDGMDVVVIRHQKNNNQLAFAGANRPLWLVGPDGKLADIKGDKKSIGGLQTEELRTFRTEIISVNTGTCIYLTSDGYADQFGGPGGKKFMTGRFKELLASAHVSAMSEQEQLLEKSLAEWKKEREQVDDICVIGIRV
ncbi:MAG: serine phosphatase RsbU, regulator of sigma subunit [Bacteroidetes bacterium]|nr:MAG: serine phosphatase RsbU, regulator of sigma subunit [Bacteroidota bacterium]